MSSPLHVFIDTSTFEELEFRWEGGLLGRLAREVAAGRVVIVTTTITKRELEGRIEHHAHHHHEALRQASKSATLLGEQPIPPPDDKRDEALKRMEKFFDEANAIVVDASKVDCQALVDRFFDVEAPFSNRKKREFPDAIAGLALEEWAVRNGVEIAVVSDDADWSGMVDTLESLEASRLGQALERVAARHHESVEAIRSLVLESTELLRRELQGPVEDRWPVLIDKAEGEAEDILLEELIDLEVDILEATPDGAGAFGVEAVLSAQLRTSAHVKYGDEESSYYDSEDKSVHFMEYASHAAEIEESLVATARLIVDVEKGYVTVEELDTNLGTTMEIYLDEDEY